ncbi:MAG TPA: methyltransferase domain-containing protein [bacterium]|nr:methyltransferase domain-containing protein [bacterium]HPR89702.1 methyltransferase domain-containing protein [bacterium]
MSDQNKAALKEFYQQVGAKYPEEEEVYHTLRGMLRRDFILARLRGGKGALLDVGCNRGMYLQAWQGGPRFGLDLSLGALQRTPADLAGRLVQGDAERLDCFRAGTFDHLLCSEVLEHCLHPQAIFAGIARVLKPGGEALLTTPNYRGVRPEYLQLGVLEAYGVECTSGPEYFHTAYRPEELEAMARQAGLEPAESGTLEKEVKYAAKLPAALLLAVRLLNRWIRSPRLGRANEAFFHTFTLACWRLARATGLEKLLLPLVKEGVRSYIVMKKPA